MSTTSVSKQTPPAVAPDSSVRPLPLLQHGDVLTRDEFERRYHAMPEVKKAELIEGRVYMPSPVRCKNHGEPDNTLAGWLFVYRAATPGVSAANNATIHLDETNEPQPDCALRIEETCGGQSFVNADDYLEGAPELVVEIAASSALYDLGAKLTAYRRNGVREYIVWAVYEQQVHWFNLAAGAEVLLQPDAAGIVRSRVFPGLWLNVPALLQDDLAGVLNSLQQGLATPEQQDFAEQLQARRK
ncbi:MAG: Uma2 family endonuclease [Acidobacteria bacterium]|nr:Uma2 family endonuclease [Acidobacteriota bacterium]